MKKLFYIVLFLVSVFGFAQNKGITYQAVIYAPGGQNVPGVNVSNIPMNNRTICLQFSLLDASSGIEYQEEVKTKTDEFGMVNITIGSGTQTGGYASSFATIVWSAAAEKSLKVSLDATGLCTQFDELSIEKLEAVPFANAAITAGNVSGVVAIANGGTGATTAAGARTNLGIENVDNTSDLNKPMSTATKIYIDGQLTSSTIVDADATTKGKLQLAGDLGGTAAAPTVPGLALKENSDNKSATTTLGTSNILFPTQNAVKTYVDTAIAGATIVDADATTKGKLQLAGDLSGTAAAPTVPALALKENVANKSTNIVADAASTTKYPSVKVIKDYVDALNAAAGVADGSITSAKIADATIVNADVAANAQIDFNKLNIQKSNILGLGIVKGDLGLGNVDNTSDAAKQVSTATQAALDLKANAVDLAAEVTRATAAEATLTTNVTANATAIAAETTRATAAEATLTTNLAAEVTRATAAEATLTTNVSANATAIAAETTRATAAETTLTTNLATEATTARAAELANSNAITAEATTARAAEATLTTNVTANATAIAAETTRATAAETTLTTNLATEATTARAAELANATAITTEATTARAAEATLTTNVTANATAIAAETTRATAAETTLTTNLAAEVTRATAAEATLTTNVTANATAIAAETTRATAAETTLATNLAAEVTRATAAEALKAPLASPTFTGTVSGITQTMVGLSNVDNTSDANKPVSTATQTALDLKENLANKSTDITVDALSTDKYPSVKLIKDYVDSSVSSGAPDATNSLKGKIQLAGDLTGNADEPRIASGSVTSAKILDGTIATIDIADAAITYAKIQNVAAGKVLGNFTGSGSAGVVEEIATTGTGDVVRAISPTFTGNVSGITKAMVGLDEVDNTSDADKPVSTATQTALDLKAPLASPTFTGTVSGITKAMVGLDEVDNTSDADKPVSTATQTALDLKAPLASPTFTGTVSGITKAMVGLDEVDNTSDADKPVSTATQTALDLKEDAANKTISVTTDGASDVKFPSAKAVKTYVDTSVAAATIADADSTTKGKIQLAGDLSGTADSPEISANAITSAKIKDGEIAATDLAANAVETAKIKNANVTNEKLATGIDATKLADGSVTNTELQYIGTLTSDAQTQIDALSTANSTNTTAITAINTLDDGKIYLGNASNVATEVTPSGDVTITNAGVTAIGTSKVVTAMLATNAVTTDKITNANVTTDKLAADAVTSSKIKDGEIASLDIANAAITYAKIQNVAAGKVLGNFTGSAGDVEEIATTGTGDVVRATSPTLVTPVLGAATGTSLSVTGQLTSTVAIGTAPLVVTSTTPVANLNIGGNASTATKLATARKINTVDFDGSADITVAAAAGTLTGTTLATNVVSSSLTSVGTIATGTWNGTTIAIANGGTGSTTQNFVDLTTAQTVAGAKTFSGNTAVSGSSTFTVGTGATALGGTLGVTGNTTLSGTLGVTGATSLSSTLAVTGNTTVGGTLGVTGNTTIGGTTTLNGNTSVSGTNTFTVGTGATALGGTLAATGATTLSSTLAVTGNTTLGGTLGVTGNTTIGGTTTLNGNTSVSGSNTLTVGTGATALGGTLTVTGASTLSSTLGVTGDVTVDTDKFKITASSGNTEIAGTLKIAGGSPGAGKVLVSDANGLASWSYSSGSVVVQNTTPYTIRLQDSFVFYTGGSNGAFTLPTGVTGKEITIKNKTANTITISGTSIYVDKDNTAATSVAVGNEASNNWIRLVFDGTQWVVFRALF